MLVGIGSTDVGLRMGVDVGTGLLGAVAVGLWIGDAGVGLLVAVAVGVDL